MRRRRIAALTLIVALAAMAFVSSVGAQASTDDIEWRRTAPETQNKDGSEPPPPEPTNPPKEIPPPAETPEPTQPPAPPEQPVETPVPSQPQTPVPEAPSKPLLPVTGVGSGSTGTGTIVLILGAMSLIALAGGFAWRGRRR